MPLTDARVLANLESVISKVSHKIAKVIPASGTALARLSGGKHIIMNVRFLCAMAVYLFLAILAAFTLEGLMRNASSF